MEFNSKALIADLQKMVTSHIEYVKHLQSLSESKVNQKLNSQSWSVLECIEHLNLYAKFYNKEIVKRISKSTKSHSEIFKSGYLGNKSAESMLPSQTMKTMNTFKSKNPIFVDFNATKVLSDFINYQEELLDLLELSKEKNLTKIKTSLTLPLLKFRLGNTFRFVIYHNERHIFQAKNVLKNLA